MLFLIGRLAESYPELVRKIIDEGHTIGGHTYSHGGANETFADFVKGNEVLTRITGLPLKYVRVPGFGYTDSDKAGCRSSGTCWKSLF